MRHALCFCLLVACKSEEAAETKPPIPAPVTFVSGSRLRATFQEVDGVKLFVSWHDAQLGRPCAFQGDLCLPGTTRIEDASLSLFDDEACTSRIAQMNSESSFGGEFDTLAVASGPSECRTMTLHLRGEAVVPARVFMRNEAGACEEVPSGGDFVRVGPALPADDRTYVRGREENDPSGGRIVTRWRVSDDGAKEIVGAWDTERNVAVVVSGSGRRWYPRDRAALYPEDRCPGIAYASSCNAAAVFIGGDGCREPEIFSVGARLPDGACSLDYGAPFEVISAVPTQAFAEAKTVQVGSGRVRLAMIARADDRPIVPVKLFDTEAGVGCQMLPSGDVFRCSPDRDSRTAPAFSDEACTKEAIVFTPGAGACDSSPDVPKIAVGKDGPVAVGARIGGAWRRTSTNACEPVSLTNDVSAYSVTPVDPSTFSILTVKTE